MKTLIDYRLVQKIVADNDAKNVVSLLEGASEVVLGWTSFLECIGLRSILDKFPEFDEKNKVFVLIKDILSTAPERELVIRLYDQIFVECLTQVKALLDVDPAYFLDQIERKRASFPFPEAFNFYEKAFTERPYEIMHDLTFHLGWDRVCVYIAALFDGGFAGSQIFKECLVESFIHIKKEGKTSPGFFRLIEALYSYYLRDENIHMHKEEEWLILSKGSASLQAREELISIPYIDGFLTDVAKDKSAIGKILTMDSMDRVQTSLNLAECIIQKLEKEDSNWDFQIEPMEILCLKEYEEGFQVDILSFGD